MHMPGHIYKYKYTEQERLANSHNVHVWTNKNTEQILAQIDKWQQKYIKAGLKGLIGAIKTN